MPYSELMIRPMREELTRIGVEELRTPEQVDETLNNTKGTVMVVVNSICGCAAGKARPGIAQALQHSVRPDKVTTVFAGRRHRSHRKSAQLFHRLRALFALNRAVEGRTAGLHDGAPSDRRQRCVSGCERTCAGFRSTLCQV